ncbi:MAG: hypothetical protein ACOY0T_09080 [Myxococcota bacterium]
MRYRKLYGDVVTASQVVCVTYVSELELFGLRSVSAGYELYSPTGQRSVVRATGPAEVYIDAGCVRIAFDTVYGRFAYELEAPLAAPRANHQLLPDLDWQVLIAAGSARVHGLAQFPELSGEGYSDRVTMSRAPRNLELSELRWGRGRVGSDHFVFTQARFKHAKSFELAVINGSDHDWLRIAPQPQTLQIQIDSHCFTLQSERVIHAGSALDSARFPNAAERLLARALSGRIEERRVLAQVRNGGAHTGLALHEHVRFGVSGHWV